jgi:uncharacterized tellurite resistance protein B-like protein
MKAAAHRAADDEVHAAPALLGAVAVADQRAAEVGRRERRQLVDDAELEGRGIERGNRPS